MSWQNLPETLVDFGCHCQNFELMVIQQIGTLGGGRGDVNSFFFPSLLPIAAIAGICCFICDKLSVFPSILLFIGASQNMNSVLKSG